MAARVLHRTDVPGGLSLGRETPCDALQTRAKLGGNGLQHGESWHDTQPSRNHVRHCPLLSLSFPDAPETHESRESAGSLAESHFGVKETGCLPL